jgi:hypothetical protein
MQLQTSGVMGPGSEAGTTSAFVERLALQLPFLKISESMGNHDSKIVDTDSVE